MPRPTKKQKIYVEPILQDFSVTSLSDNTQDVLPPSDLSLLQRIMTYNVSLPDMTFNKTEDVNISTGPYPPDSTIVDIIQDESHESLFKKPFNVRNRGKPRPNLFDSDIEDSEPDASEQKMSRPFQRKTKVPISTDKFDIDLSSESLNTPNSASTPIKKLHRPFQRKNKVPVSTHLFDVDLLNKSANTSNSVSNFITRRKNRRNKAIEINLFDKDLNNSESDSSALCQNLLKHRTKYKKVTTAAFDGMLDDTLNESQNNMSKHDQLPFKSVKTRKRNVDPNMFDDVVNSSDSCEQSSSYLQKDSLPLTQLQNQTVESRVEPNTLSAVNEAINNRSEIMNRKEQMETFFEQTNKMEENTSTENMPVENSTITCLEKECTSEKDIIEVGHFKSSNDELSSVTEKKSFQNDTVPEIRSNIISSEGSERLNLRENNYSIMSSIEDEEASIIEGNSAVKKTFNDTYSSCLEIDALTVTAKGIEFNSLEHIINDDVCRQKEVQYKESSYMQFELLKTNEKNSISKRTSSGCFRLADCPKEINTPNILNSDNISDMPKYSASIKEKRVSFAVENNTINSLSNLLVSDSNSSAEYQRFSNINNSQLNKTGFSLKSLVCESNTSDLITSDSEYIDLHPKTNDILTPEYNLSQSNNISINTAEKNTKSTLKYVDGNYDCTEHQSSEDNNSINKEVLIENEDINDVDDKYLEDEEVDQSTIREDTTVEEESKKINMTADVDDEGICQMAPGCSLEFENGDNEELCKTQGNKLIEEKENCISQSNVKLKKNCYLSEHDSKNQFSKKNGKEVFKQPHPVPLNKTKVQEILDKIPLSELKNKQPKPVRRTPGPSKEQMVHDDIEQPLKKRHVQEKKISGYTSNKLKRPKKWVTPMLYKFIINKLQPIYGLKSRIEAENTVLFLANCVEEILRRNCDYFEIVKEMRNELAKKGIIYTHWDFYEFVMRYFDGDFKSKLYPLGDEFQNFVLPDDPFENIL